ncbi:MAG: sensor histidine kinase [Streptosporangiales bacterium]|nr:sensor histidine kinase [Streptosporangiales bacterium]
MADLRALSETRREQFYRWAPPGLLGLATLIAAATAPVFLDATERWTAAALVAAAMLVQLTWGRVRRTRPDPSPAGLAYFVIRYVLAFVLTYLNPFFSIYAVAGYFDAGRLLPRRGVLPGALATAVIMAGAQTGGLPPRDAVTWGAFGALLVLHATLVLVFTHLEGKDAERTQANETAIVELERTNARLEEAMAENAALHAQLLVQAREAGADDERHRLAAEIHDTIAQGLTGIITQLQASADAADPATARAHVQRAAELARNSLREARRAVRDLGPGALEHDALPEALKKAVDDWSGASSVPAAFTVTGTVQPLHDEVAGTLLRIAQEALANAGRYAHAGRVGVTLSYMDDEITLDVRDDGRGFDPAAVAGHGFGLAGMRARAERLAGSLEVESAPGAGTAVSARVPLVRHA